MRNEARRGRAEGARRRATELGRGFTGSLSCLREAFIQCLFAVTRRARWQRFEGGRTRIGLCCFPMASVMLQTDSCSRISSSFSSLSDLIRLQPLSRTRKLLADLLRASSAASLGREAAVIRCPRRSVLLSPSFSYCPSVRVP